MEGTLFLLSVFYHLFKQNSLIEVFDERISNSKDMLGESIKRMKEGYEMDHAKATVNIQNNFQEYKENASGFSLERTREIIKQTLSN